METNRGLALKAGLFVIAGLLLAAVIIFGIEGWQIFRPGYQIDLVFESASGVLKGAPVKFAGVEVGEVSEIAVARDEGSRAPKVQVKVWLPAHLKLRSDDEAWIGILGLLGEKYVEILAGPGSGAILKPGDALIGAGVVSELEFTQSVTETITKLDGLLQTGQKMLSETQLPDRITATLEQAAELTEQLKTTAQEADQLLGQLQSATTDASKALKNFQRWAPWIVLGALGLLIAPIILLLLR